MQRRSEFFATGPPGLGRLLRDQLAGIGGVEILATGSDGESDVVLFEADRAGRVRAAAHRGADGVFATAARARRDGTTDPAVLAARCWPRDSAQRALSLWAEQVQPLSSALSYRITARTRTGPRSLQSGLRPALADVVRRDRPRWRPSGQGVLEILLSEWRAGELVTGLRLGGNRGDQAASVPPAVAAAMVTLAGPPDGVLLDPSCGDGAILAEAVAAGWVAEGTGRDPDVAGQARSAGAAVRAGDAAEILEPDGAVSACVTRLPAGPGLAAALAEMSRVTRTGGAVVLLAADVPRTAWPPALRLRKQLPVQLAAGRETIWVYRRA
jgi:Putative RNA methylase family UPF0020